MPTPPSEEPLTKVTLNLFTKDVLYLKGFSDNWSVAARTIIREWILKRKERYNER